MCAFRRKRAEHRRTVRPGREAMSPVGRRVFPALLVILAAYADSRDSSRIAFDLLLLAVPFACVAGLSAFERFLGERGDPVAALQVLGWAFGVVLLTLSCAVPSRAAHALPRT